MNHPNERPMTTSPHMNHPNERTMTTSPHMNHSNERTMTTSPHMNHPNERRTAPEIAPVDPSAWIASLLPFRSLRSAGRFPSIVPIVHAGCERGGRAGHTASGGRPDCTWSNDARAVPTRPPAGVGGAGGRSKVPTGMRVGDGEVRRARWKVRLYECRVSVGKGGEEATHSHTTFNEQAPPILIAVSGRKGVVGGM